jgi:hypothetical protein
MKPPHLILCSSASSSSAWGNIEGVVIITDYDLAVGAAIHEVAPDAVHLLCTWHQIESIAKNCRPAISGEFENFNAQFFRVRDSITGEFRNGVE